MARARACSSPQRFSPSFHINTIVCKASATCPAPAACAVPRAPPPSCGHIFSHPAPSQADLILDVILETHRAFALGFDHLHSCQGPDELPSTTVSFDRGVDAFGAPPAFPSTFRTISGCGWVVSKLAERESAPLAKMAQSWLSLGSRWAIDGLWMGSG